jgi:thiol:disulfide interchange protein
MDTFKHIMGFVLLATVAFILSFIAAEYVVPTFLLLVGVWFGCWWIGRTPLTAETGAKFRAWAVGVTAAVLVGLLAFNFSFPGQRELPWEPYTRAALDRELAQGRTVLVDFTADWCLTCQANSKLSINRREVYDLVHENGVVPLLADKTEESLEIDQLLTDLDSISIPVLAIFPASDPQRPIVLRDAVTKGQVLAALREAGPSRGAAATAAVGGLAGN